jgi:hypothetical protein
LDQNLVRFHKALISPGTYEIEEGDVKGFDGGNLKKRNNFENVVVNGKIIVNLILKFRVVVLDWIDLAKQ